MSVQGHHVWMLGAVGVALFLLAGFPSYEGLSHIKILKTAQRNALVYSAATRRKLAKTAGSKSLKQLVRRVGRSAGAELGDDSDGVISRLRHSAQSMDAPYPEISKSSAVRLARHQLQAGAPKPTLPNVPKALPSEAEASYRKILESSRILPQGSSGLPVVPNPVSSGSKVIEVQNTGAAGDSKPLKEAVISSSKNTASPQQSFPARPSFMEEYLEEVDDPESLLRSHHQHGNISAAKKSGMEKRTSKSKENPELVKHSDVFQASNPAHKLWVIRLYEWYNDKVYRGRLGPLTRFFDWYYEQRISFLKEKLRKVRDRGKFKTGEMEELYEKIASYYSKRGFKDEATHYIHEAERAQMLSSGKHAPL